MKNVLKKAIDFHGHLGPFLVIGTKMGLMALKNHSISKVTAETGKKPPLSCMVDGIQVTTGCTLGKGNIEIVNNNRPKATFFGGSKNLEIELKKDVFEKILEWLKTELPEKTAERIMKLGDDELFVIRLREKKNA